MLGKRKRSGSTVSKRPYQYARITRPIALRGRVARRQRGFVRTGGFYGRYPPSGNEAKFFEDTQDVNIITTAGIIAFISVNRIPQGVTESTRVGRKCVITKLMFRGYCQINPVLGTTTACNSVRILVYLDKQANGATATVANILQSGDEKSFNNLSNSQRFTIFKDKTLTFNMTYGSGTDTVAQILPFNFFKKCNIPIEFSSTTGAITEIRSNNIGVLAICGVQSGTIPNTSLVLTSRVRFTDG